MMRRPRCFAMDGLGRCLALVAISFPFTNSRGFQSIARGDLTAKEALRASQPGLRSAANEFLR